MVEIRWIKLFLFVILLLQFTAVTGQYSSLAVRVGEKVTLSNENLMEDQDECDGTYWTYTGSGNLVELVSRGKISEDAKDKSDRLSVTENCSLVIKKVTAEDVGLYRNRQYNSEQQQGRGALIHLTIINMTEHEDDDNVTLTCSLSRAWCGHTVNWLYDGKNVDEVGYMNASVSECSATVTFPSPYLKLKSKFLEFFQCEVTAHYNRAVQLFTFSPQSSGEDKTTSTPTTTNPGEDRTTAPEVTDT
ncbi:uncharacterized protein AKAME5_000928900 [Lates japonicus]|uniref:Immunoglobulin V-set domain-containing protein n=1 Tax=Lates japonicus TaxID=270547 RepID=A0AAD3MNJ8_LATJO|nr:uncharacterized protein AKAME5_000928900 [Lates japonicus]